MNVEKMIYKLLTTSTGIALLDSGGEDGRNWQRNQKKTLTDFQNEPSVSPFKAWELNGITSSADLSPTVSVFHHLVNSLELDDLCVRFNKLPSKDWDSDLAYGLSLRGERWLTKYGFEIMDTWNSYNGESNLSQVLQGANLSVNGGSNFEYPEYILLQIHQGADVRGGYTDAKLFKVKDGECFDVNPNVYGDIDGIQVDTCYNGWSLTDDDGEPVEMTATSKINLYLEGE